MEATEKDQEIIQTQLEILRFLSESTDDYLFSWSFQSDRIYFPSPIWKRYALMEPGQTVCTVEDWYKAVYEKDLPMLQAEFERLRRGEIKKHNMEYRLVDREGNRVWISCRGQCQMDKSGHPLRMIGRISDTALAGEVDALTGAFTSARLQKDIKRILDRGTPGFLLLLGIDNLKNINIRHGRDYGNHTLQTVADTLEKCVSTGLRIYRVNGDCFAINLPTPDLQDVEAFYEQVRERLKVHCTVSAGAVAYHNHPNEDSSSLYQYAEDALDKAKRMGKDTLSFFSQKDYEEKLYTIELQEEIHQSIQNGFEGFYICYQPQIHSRSYDIFGAEALLRFNSPTRGAVSPQELIPILEQSGMICQVGLWVLETALQQCLVWRKAIPQMHISVNISYVQLAQKNISKLVLETVEKSGLPGEALTLEVTESMQLQDYSLFNKIFYQWKQAGIEISVDDFGTGYSSLSYLKGMEVDEIKIDRCFVSGIQHSAYNYRLLSNMIELAHSSQIRVCCEGVESQEELATLEKLHPDLLQGFLFHKPYTAEQFEACFIQKGSAAYTSRVRLQKALRGFQWNPGSFPTDIVSTPETLKTVLDAMDEVIYVSDLVTYELYYLNPAGRRLTGVYDYQGQKCYKVLQGKDDPCEFCTNDCLKRDSFYIWERDNKLLNCHFILKDKLIPWCGKMARLEIAIDVSEHEMVSQRVREKLDFAQSVLACAQILAEESDMKRATLHMLQLVGEFYQADRAYIFEPDDGAENVWNNTYEWNREGVKSEQEQLQKVPETILRRWFDIFHEQKAVVISDVEELRESQPEEWETLHFQGIRRLLASPVWQGKNLTGFLGVDNPRHCIADDSLIRMLSLFLNNRFHHNETEERLGELLNLHYQDILKNTDLGLWVIRLDPQSGQGEMFADETMRRILGLEKVLSPTECYRYWYGRVKEGYCQYVDQTVKKLVDSRRVVQLEYPWEHPTLGEVMVRCTGIRTEDADGMICLEGYHRIISGVDHPVLLPDARAEEVFEFNENTGSIHFHTRRMLLAGEESYEEHFPQCWLNEKIVHPHFAKQFADLFQDVAHSHNLDDQEILLRGKHGNYEWFVLRIRHGEGSSKNPNSVTVLLDAADPERVLQLENMRIRDFYRASLSEAIAYAELDLESNQFRAAGGLWAGYEKEPLEEHESLLDFMKRKSKDQVRFLDQPPLDGFPNNDQNDPQKLLSTQPDTHRLRYQRLLDGQWIWVELVAHTFRERFTENAYALLYLKNIDVQTRRELAHRDAAQRDPLTNVYNRTTFRKEVEKYLSAPDSGRTGVMILLDVDNFKRINDHYGHLEGDRVLKRVTILLQNAFQSDDLIGRLGGDEFMVFIKGGIRRSSLEERLQSFLHDLQGDKAEPITCSAGITFVKGGAFSFEESVCQADMALYKSKQTGKNHFCYAEDTLEKPKE
nr:EAL domain-containing protein [uncultured Dysosmobacter sp.]